MRSWGNSDSVILNATDNDLIWIETSLPKAMAMSGGATQQADSWKHFVVYAQYYSLLNGVSSIPNDNESNSKYILKWNNIFNNYKPMTLSTIFNIQIPKDHYLITDNNKMRIIEGSGCNYLSNEIFYRVVLSRERWQQLNPALPKFPTGHFHVAKIQYNNVEVNDVRDLSDKYFTSDRTIYDELTKLIRTVEERITLGINNINNLF